MTEKLSLQHELCSICLTLKYIYSMETFCRHKNTQLTQCMLTSVKLTLKLNFHLKKAFQLFIHKTQEQLAPFKHTHTTNTDKKHIITEA